MGRYDIMGGPKRHLITLCPLYSPTEGETDGAGRSIKKFQMLISRKLVAVRVET
jgi:hypothetical protein